ncbi:ABC transporter ATP-binding protein [Lyngbya confervoides]|uniref:Energy-coupling factor ABC transporter ATP-binding protein n=1 Tax=Lyngbya confervoides BDU141951 TaxID=1574623 RepID=A0ABD4T7H7_9CYAN|nr:ABC transporter ATP-binding protein [Lyngbya confervoides]MCM1984394.1 energy-coupling factor ABC transporter ATP-binding protein [Lyngbya confervoides BDU141951]
MLRIKNLNYHPTATAAPILWNISLELAPQQMGLVVGPSGSGKSTLLEILGGLSKPSRGELYWDNKAIPSDQLSRFSGLVFQFPERHFCGGTLLEELRFGHPELTSDQVSEALKEVGLGDLSLKTSPQSLSGGQQRRLALAVQLIRQPALLLMDEPTAGLDWSMRQQLTRLLAKIKQHWSLLVVSHDPVELLPIADRCWTLNHGQLHPVQPQDLMERHDALLANPSER